MANRKDAMERNQFLGFATKVVEFGKSARKLRILERRRKSDGSWVTSIDISLENDLILAATKRWGLGVGILSEETKSSYRIPVQKPLYVSIDSTDGTAALLADLPEWSISVGLRAKQEDPERGLVDSALAAVVVQPMLDRAFCAVRRGAIFRYDYTRSKWRRFKRVRALEPTIGMDLSGDVPDACWLQNARLSRALNVRPVNWPAVHAGLQILNGNARSWISYTAHHWDLAATALFLEMMGGVAECLDGSPIPWDRTQMPPIILAESPEEADRVRRTLFPSKKAKKPKGNGKIACVHF